MQEALTGKQNKKNVQVLIRIFKIFRVFFFFVIDPTHKDGKSDISQFWSYCASLINSTQTTHVKILFHNWSWIPRSKNLLMITWSRNHKDERRLLFYSRLPPSSSVRVLLWVATVGSCHSPQSQMAQEKTTIFSREYCTRLILKIVGLNRFGPCNSVFAIQFFF